MKQIHISRHLYDGADSLYDEVNKYERPSRDYQDKCQLTAGAKVVVSDAELDSAVKEIRRKLFREGPVIDGQKSLLIECKLAKDPRPGCGDPCRYSEVFVDMPCTWEPEITAKCDLKSSVARKRRGALDSPDLPHTEKTWLGGKRDGVLRLGASITAKGLDKKSHLTRLHDKRAEVTTCLPSFLGYPALEGGMNSVKDKALVVGADSELNTVLTPGLDEETEDEQAARLLIMAESGVPDNEWVKTRAPQFRMRFRRTATRGEGEFAPISEQPGYYAPWITAKGYGDVGRVYTDDQNLPGMICPIQLRLEYTLIDEATRDKQRSILGAETQRAQTGFQMMRFTPCDDEDIKNWPDLIPTDYPASSDVGSESD